LHLEENRGGTTLIKVTANLTTSDDYSLLGYAVGMLCTEGIPVFDGVPGTAVIDNLKQLGAALASSSAIALYHVVGVTPEAPTLETAFRGRAPVETFELTDADLAATRDYLTKTKAGDRDASWVVIGCPHASLREVAEIGRLLAGRKVHPDVAFWVVTSSCVRETARSLGYLAPLQEAGCRVVTDTCPVLTYSREIAGASGYATLTTNSAKMAHYAPGQFGVLSRYASLPECVEAAVKGAWTGSERERSAQVGVGR